MVFVGLPRLNSHFTVLSSMFISFIGLRFSNKAMVTSGVKKKKKKKKHFTIGFFVIIFRSMSFPRASKPGLGYMLSSTVDVCCVFCLIEYQFTVDAK